MPEFANPFNKVIEAAEAGDLQAIHEVSLKALGGDKEAQEIINRIDSQVRNGELEIIEGNIIRQVSDVGFILRHPRLALRTKIRQELVGLEHALPPHTSTVEDFCTLPLQEAAKLLQEAEEEN